MSRPTLHSLATKNEDAKRLRALEEDPYRSPFARDKDRILYSRSFRRLAYKTQVYLISDSNQNMRSRLTHTLEVTNIARSIARNLGMNEDLTEAISFGHDVGHPPFGHAGEQELDAFLNGDHQLPRHIQRLFATSQPPREHCDFRHNYQSVRLLSFLERYEASGYDVPGLNLTLQTFEGILKHTSLKSKRSPNEKARYPDAADKLFERLTASSGCSHIEGQIVAVADEIAQVAHDLADALHSEGIALADPELHKHLRPLLEQENAKAVLLRKALQDQDCRNHMIPAIAAQIASVIISHFVVASITWAKKRLESARRVEEVGELWPRWHLVPGDFFDELKEFKDRTVVNSFNVNRMDNKGMYIIRKLIDAYLSDSRQLPDPALGRFCMIKHYELKRLQEDGVRRWFAQQKELAGLPQIPPNGLDEVIALMRRPTSWAKAFRGLKTNTLKMLMPYLVLDLDYLRTIADHIALMTDSFAESEMNRLYGVR